MPTAAAELTSRRRIALWAAFANATADAAFTYGAVLLLRWLPVTAVALVAVRVVEAPDGRLNPHHSRGGAAVVLGVGVATLLAGLVVTMGSNLG